jgi:hypothetical protein
MQRHAESEISQRLSEIHAKQYASRDAVTLTIDAMRFVEAEHLWKT